jgi:glucose/arabinose dehydrogenase
MYSSAASCNGTSITSLAGLVLMVLACGDQPAPQGPDPDPDPGPDPTALAMSAVASGLDAPVLLTAPPGDARSFIVEQSGRVRVLEGGVLRPTPFLDITDRVRTGGERGLLGLAFHPDHATNGSFYVHYTRADGASRIARFEVGADPDVADPASEAVVLEVAQPFSNHNAGMLAFGPGGELFIALGDGGGAGDPGGNGQNTETLLGSLLRIDVDAAEPYAIPPGNPFEEGGGRPEIWAWGLRNPWRFSIDPAGSAIWIGDVGQDRAEEINRRPSGQAGVNYGWNIAEGFACFQQSSCDMVGLAAPFLEYDHDEGCSVIGGFVYRGAAAPALRGQYFYSDFCSGFVRSVAADASAPNPTTWATPPLGRVLSFGRDAAGELYVLTAAGVVWRIDGVDG